VCGEYQSDNGASGHRREELGDAEYDLAQTTVRAPTEGFVTQVALRPGMNVVPAPLRPVMVFVHTGVRDQMLAAAFQQNAFQRVRTGDEPKSHSMVYREGFSKLKFVN